MYLGKGPVMNYVSVVGHKAHLVRVPASAAHHQQTKLTAVRADSHISVREQYLTASSVEKIWKQMLS